MPKKNHKRRNLKGGFSDSLGKTFSDLGNSISQGASNFWNKTKKAIGLDTYSSPSTSSSYTPSTGSTYTPSTSSTYTPTTTSSTYSYGGKRQKKGTRKMKRTMTMKRGGNFKPNSPIDTLASRSFPYTGLTARVNDMVGGKKKRTMRSRR
jgi:hypothetical protein